jgi:hypothetical protein
MSPSDAGIGRTPEGRISKHGKTSLKYAQNVARLGGVEGRPSVMNAIAEPSAKPCRCAIARLHAGGRLVNWRGR